MTLKRLTVYGVLCSCLYLPPAYALDAQTTQQYCESVNDAAKAAMERHIKTRTPKDAPSNMFTKSVKTCADGILGMGLSLALPGAGDIMGALKGLAQKAMDAACRAATEQFDAAVGDALGSVNERFDDFNNAAGTSIGVGSNNNGGFGVTSDGNSAADKIDQAGSDKINSSINLK